ncbi:unnamed protein product [Allacma fusca]|uniref:DUF4200 domain-containing protein n=1 Tax=Allacma fusca TaxID=39272 RepID=A0A8J2LNN3_9HEXA|nr:unnamed protein product [Allacma fusca]
MSTDGRPSHDSQKGSLQKKQSNLRRISLAEKAAGRQSAPRDENESNASGKNSQPRRTILSNPNTKMSSKLKHIKIAGLHSSLSTRASQLLDVPVYLNPQPKFFIDHMAEDMVVEPIDPMASTEEEDEVVQEIFTEDYDDDFDYESLYTDEPAGTGDDFDDYIIAETTQPSETQIGVNEEEEEEGGEVEEQVIEQPVDDNLEECDDRSDDEIAHERMLQELYQNAFAEIMGVSVGESAAVAPSITQKTLDDYFLDREEEKIDMWKDCYSGWFYTDGSEILHRRKILACLESILVKERIKYKLIKNDFNKRWEDGQTKQIIIDGALVKFDGYYRETLGKRNRAIQQTAHELAQKMEKERELSRYKKELDFLVRLQEQCEKRLSQFRIFERYLTKVRDESHGEFADVRDIIDRYGVLSQARTGLISRDLRNQDRIERAQNSLKRTMELRSNELLVYNNYLSELRVYRDNILEEILQLEEMLLHIKTTAASRTLLIGQIKMAINNLYLGLCRQLNRAAKIPMEDTLKQLNYIKGSMREIIKLSRDVKQMLKNAAQAAERDRKEKERLERENRKHKYKYGSIKGKAVDYLALFGIQQDES